MKLSEYVQGILDGETRAETIRQDGEKLVKWGVMLLDKGRDMIADVDTRGLPPDAVEQLDAYRKMLDEGPPDGSPFGGAAAEQKPEPRKRLPKGLQQTILMTVEDHACPIADLLSPKVTDQDVKEAARKNNLVVWTRGVTAYVGTEAQRAAMAIGCERAHPAEVKAADQECLNLAARIRALPGFPSFLPSDAAETLKVPLQAVRDAWPLLTGEKAP